MTAQRLETMTGEFRGPGPVVHPETRPFWDRLAELGVFSVARCASCSTLRFPLSPTCHVCLSLDHDWVDLQPAGRISAVTRVERATGDGAWREAVPFEVAVVDMPEGVRVPGRVLCTCGGGYAHGADVTMCLLPTADGGVVPGFAHACRTAVAPLAGESR